MKQPRLILNEGRRKNLSTISLIDPSPKQLRKASIQLPKSRDKENIPEQKYKSGEEIKRQISQLIKKPQPQRSITQFKKKLEIVCEENVEVDVMKNYIQPPNECAFDDVALRYLYQKEQEYKVHQVFFDHQTQITPIMRAILVDWLSEVCKDFALKRETFHLCVQNMDRYLSKVQVAKKEFQMVGLSHLFIACKIEEIYPPKVSDFSRASNGGFTAEQLLECEQKILQSLKWLLNPPTLYLWSTWYMSQWDLYYTQKNNRVMQLKQPSQQSYTLFRQFMAFLDCTLLDSKIYQHQQREIVASLLYLVLLKQYSGSTFSRLAESKVMDREVLEFQSIFKPFLEMVFGFQFNQLNRTMRYLQKFMKLEIVIDQPSTPTIAAERELEEAYEYFLSIQTHNATNLQYINKL